jgi:hypothetical protein
MGHEQNLNVLTQIIEEVEKLESAGESKYSHAVQVLTPIELLQQVDQLVEANPRLTRPIIFRRALRVYLDLLKKTGHLDLKPKARRRIA